jgi:hypothetical protein
MSKLTTANEAGLKQLEEHLGKHPYATEGPLPSQEDAQIFSEFKGTLY